MNNWQSGRGYARQSGFSTAALVVGLLVLAAVALVVWQKRDTIWAKDDEDKDKDPTVELAAADIATVSLSTLSRSLPVTGSLSPLTQTTVKAQSPGEVLEVTVREGQAVNEGDVLVRIDTRNLVAALESRQAELEKARADLSLARLNLEKSEAVLKKGFISQNAHDATVAAHEAGLATVKAAEAQLSLARIALGYAQVAAPFAGTVSARLVQPGEKVEIGSNLIGLVDLAHLEFQAPAPAYDVPAVKIGQIARFKVGGFGERVFEGRVERINPMTDTGSRSVMLYLSVDNSDGALKGGMFAQGELILDRTEPVPAIPLTALHEQAGLPYVYTIEQQKIGRRHVELGLRAEEQNLVEVRKGLKPGEQVVAARIVTLKEGAPVVIAAPAAQPATAATR